MLEVSVSSTFATAQFPDKIIFKGQEFSLFSNPMEKYFEKNPDKKPIGGIISALWRSYVATFENYHELEIKEGNFVQSKQFNSKSYKKFKDRQFAKYKETDDYKKTKERLVKEGRTEDEIDIFLRSFVTDYTSVILDD